MGNKESSVGILSFKEGTSLVRFPTVEVVREGFLLYHMNIIPTAITHTPSVTNNAKIRDGGNERGSFHLYSQEHYQIFPLTW